MREFKSTPKWRTAILLFGVWTLVGLAFTALSSASATIENEHFALHDALRQNLPDFYIWGALSPLIFRFSHRFPVEFRPLLERGTSTLLIFTIVGYSQPAFTYLKECLLETWFGPRYWMLWQKCVTLSKSGEALAPAALIKPRL